MELIIRLKNKLNLDEIEIIKRLGAEVIFESQYIPLIGVTTEEFSDISKFEKLPFVDSVRMPVEGEYLEGEYLTTYIFEPRISRRSLANSNHHGWGDTRVAVIDSGVNRPWVVEHKDFTNTGHVDFFGHGSLVADTLKYFAKGINMYSAKIGNEKPYDIATMRALEWAAKEKNVNVINLSIGFKYKDCQGKGECDLSQIVNGIVNEGVIVVVAAGNGGPTENTLRCPACASGAITVGALEKEETVADYSSRGSIGGSKPNIVAPGLVYIDGNAFGGTSCSAPIVSGTIAAVIKNVNNTRIIYRALYESATNIKEPQNAQGMGALNIDKFVEVINNETMGSQSKRQEPS